MDRLDRDNGVVKFLLLIHNNPEALEGLTAEQRRALIGGDDLVDRIGRLRSAGELVQILALELPSESKTVQTVAGTPVISDRPFLETKEFLAGALVVEVPSIDRALEIAADVPYAAVQRIEVRPIRDLDEAGLAQLDPGE
ncbi:YciI family protein [Kribbella italica]